MKKWGIPLYCIWSALSVVLLVGLIVINYCFEKPTTLGIQYFDGIKVNDNIETDDVDESTIIPLIELNIRQSATNPDINLYEMVISGYTDYEQQDYKRCVMQVVGDYTYVSLSKVDESWNEYESSIRTIDSYLFDKKEIFFYEISSSETWKSMTHAEFENFLDSLMVTAGGEDYLLEVGGPDGDYSYTHYYYKNWWNEFIDNESEETVTLEYNSIDLFHSLMNGFVTNRDFEGYKLFKNLDLDRFLTIKKSNGSGQYYSINDFTDNNAYFSVKFSNKMITSHLESSDSIIGVIAKDINFSSGVINTVKPAYATNVEHTLNEYILTKKYDSTINKYVLTISDDYKNYLLSLNNLNVVINVDIDNITSVDVCGIDLNNFNKLNLVGLNISSEETKNFYILGSVKTIKDYSFSETLTVLNSEGGVWHE